MVFFLCSGFIVPASLERGGPGASRAATLACFWRSRVFRLYPLYWVSLAGAAILVVVGVHAPAPMTGRDWLANLTMLQAFAGSPHALDLYWTLAFEMAFYLALSALFLLGRHRSSVTLSLAASAGCVVAALAAGPLLGRPAPLGLFCLATMFTGTVFFRWHAGTVALRTLVGCVVAALAAGTTMLGAAAQQPGGQDVLPMLTAWVGAYAIVGTAVALRSRRVPAWLRRLGTISYSVYLMQALVLLAVPATPFPVLTAVVWVAVIVAVSEGTYRLVEQPAVRLGRRLGAGRPVAGPVPFRGRSTGRALPAPRSAGRERIAV
jgi:peptidoglycan/LPS O-acetylase OafA/YrhL